MNASTAPAPPPPNRAARPSLGQRWFHGLGLTGFAIVAFVALITSLNTTTKFLVIWPLQRWFLQFLEDLAFHSFIGVAILLGAVWARNRFPMRGARQYVVAFAAVTVATAAALLLINGWQYGWTFGTEDPNWTLLGVILFLGPDLVRYSFVGVAITSTWLYVRTEADHAVALEQVAVDSARMDQQTAEARLQMLEAQIEPHFLFNTLANVKRLYETDRPSGARMLRNLKEYLAVALPQMRAADSTLGREIDHVTAYLDIQQIRMGRRLAFGIDVPEALRDARMPPLMLLTLVENAIKHGLTPLPEGGRIDVRASIVDGQMRVQVADTGQGFTKSGGGGTGLANIRARLSTQFGAAASLSLALNNPRGVVATLVFPYSHAVPTRDHA
jgi:signal transduction histidine kinase